MHRTFWIVLLPYFALAQGISPALEPAPQWQELLEDHLQNRNAAEATFDFSTLTGVLEEYRHHPLNLNEAGEEELRMMHLLSDRQILELLRYRRETGPLISLYELQAIPSFDLATIRRLLPFVRLRRALDDFQVSIPQMLKTGKNEVFVRWSRIAERQKGYTPRKNPAYLGDPNQLYFRYRHSFSNKLRYGLTAEKDRGEAFFTGSNKRGFDYYSAHFYLRDYNRTLRALALGDFSVSFGQGLLLFSGFGYGKGAATTSIKRSGRSLTPYSSVNEAQFMRGAGATLAFSNHLEATFFASLRRRDGILEEPDHNTPGPKAFTGLKLDGYHRTAGEIASKKTVRQFTTGGSLRLSFPQGHVAFNTLYNTFHLPLRRKEKPYNRFYFSGRRLWNASLDYSLTLKNLNFFGETALSANGRMATVNGLLVGLDRRVDLALLFRHYPRDYQALNATPFAEAAGGRNETGCYLGLEIRPAKSWTLNAYYDMWHHPWLRFLADAPSRGREIRARLMYSRKRQLRVYMELKNEWKELNAPDDAGAFERLLPHRLFQCRLHIARHISKALEWRTRFDWGFAANPVEGKRYGLVLLQDLLFRPIGFPLSFTTRFAVFDTEDYDIRFYHYENNLLYTSSIPAYYNRGTRFYLNLRYRPVQALTLEFRFAQTFRPGEESIGSGQEASEGPVRTELGAQVKVQFGN